MTEIDIQNTIRLNLSRDDVRLFRNAVGVGWSGTLMHKGIEGVYLKGARAQTYGLGTGSPDLVGWRSIVITPDMVGKRVAVFVGLEVKGPRGRVTFDQQNWQSILRRNGAITAIVRNVEEARDAIEKGIP